MNSTLTGIASAVALAWVYSTPEAMMVLDYAIGMGFIAACIIAAIFYSWR